MFSYANYTELEEEINYTFKSSNLIIQALSHKSVDGKKNNERLEFLGDAVLNLVVGNYLYHRFSDLSEGKLSKMRASLVNEDSLVKFAKTISLGKYIFISEAEERNKGRYKKSIVSDCFEAIIGAIYIESNMDFVENFIIETISKTYENLDLTKISQDYKTKLQEITQASLGVIPDYRIISSDGPDHNKLFIISAFINDVEYGQGKGINKKKAEQNAAKKAVSRLKQEAKNKENDAK